MKAYRTWLIAAACILTGILLYHNRGCLLADKKNEEKTDNAQQVGTDELSAVSFDGDAERFVCPSGEPVGIYVKTKGVMVIAVNQINTAEGMKPSPCEGILKAGDYIMRINNQTVNDKATMMRKIQESKGEEMLFYVCRGTEYFNIRVTPVKTASGSYAVGVWVKDDIAGIGTITYTDGDRFAALGHSINDSDTGLTFRVSDGAIYETTIIHIRKPQTHTPGRLEGVINYAGQYVIGRVEENSLYGIHGYLTKRQQEKHKDDSKVPVGSREEVHIGTAYLKSSLSGSPEEYEIEIVSVDADNENGKCMEIAVTDPELLALTGGIVQGISGTPILQDGKLIGAVTHVFVDDPTRGYGIFIEEMLQ